MRPTVLGPGMFFSPRHILVTDRVLVDHVKYLRRRNGTVPRDVLELAEDVHLFAAEIRRNLPPRWRTSRTTPRPRTPHAPTTPEWLTADQAATLTGLTKSYLCRLARRGDLYATRAADGRTWLIDADSLTAWTSTRTTPTDTS